MRDSALGPDRGARWAGRTVIITGSTSGIGRATAELFAAGGAHVVVHGLEPDQAAEMAEMIEATGGSATTALLDLRDFSSAQRLIDHALDVTGRVDVLVNNAGANGFRGILGATLADWDGCLDLDLRAVWLCAQAAARVMRPGSAIVNVSSRHATSTLPGAFPYNVAKAAVLALTQSLAIDSPTGAFGPMLFALAISIRRSTKPTSRHSATRPPRGARPRRCTLSAASGPPRRSRRPSTSWPATSPGSPPAPR
jgi:NAD(P)-dependent dehydrogenase (short-subunit alcohol dehydrogenase family)